MRSEASGRMTHRSKALLVWLALGLFLLPQLVTAVEDEEPGSPEEIEVLRRTTAKALRGPVEESEYVVGPGDIFGISTSSPTFSPSTSS